MMPTFPQSSLSFRTAGFPRYGWKAGMSDSTFPRTGRLKPAPGIHRLMFGLCLRSCSTICGWLRPGARCCRSSPAAASGSRSPPMPIRSTSTSLSRPSGNSGAASRAASPLASLVSIHQSRGSRPSGVVDMSASNSWAEFAGLFRNTRQAFLDHERSKTELKALMPEDAKEAIGHRVRAKRSKSGAVSFDLLEAEANRAAL